MKRAATPFRPWKPEKCHDCGAPHPAFSRNHMRGPWRCGPCDKIAGAQA